MPNTKVQIESAAAGVLSNAMATADPKAQFCQLWSSTIKPTLELVKKFTGARMDAKIDKLEAACDSVCDGTNPSVAEFCKIWNDLHIEALLKFLEVFVGPNVKKVIDKFIELADSLCAA